MSFPYPEAIPDWARRLRERIAECETAHGTHAAYVEERLRRFEERIMATVDDLKGAISALVQEDGLIIAKLQELQNSARATGSVSASEVDDAVGQINSEVSRLAQALQGLDDGDGVPDENPAPAGDGSGSSGGSDGSNPVTS